MLLQVSSAFPFRLQIPCIKKKENLNEPHQIFVSTCIAKHNLLCTFQKCSAMIVVSPEELPAAARNLVIADVPELEFPLHNGSADAVRKMQLTVGNSERTCN